MEPSDEELVLRARGGEMSAYAVLVDRFYPRLLRFAMRNLGNRADAEEAVQDTLVRAHRSLGRYEERSRFEPWVFRILLNQCHTIGAKRRRRERTFVPYGPASDAVSARPAIEIHWEAQVQDALMRLAPEAREALLLKYVEDKSYEDIADLTGVRVSALKMRVKRAREQLRALLQGVIDG